MLLFFGVSGRLVLDQVVRLFELVHFQRRGGRGGKRIPAVYDAVGEEVVPLLTTGNDLPAQPRSVS